MGAEGGLVDVGWPHPHLVIPRAEIQLGEETRPMELIKQLVNY